MRSQRLSGIVTAAGGAFPSKYAKLVPARALRRGVAVPADLAAAGLVPLVINHGRQVSFAKMSRTTSNGFTTKKKKQPEKAVTLMESVLSVLRHTQSLCFLNEEGKTIWGSSKETEQGQIRKICLLRQMNFLLCLGKWTFCAIWRSWPRQRQISHSRLRAKNLFSRALEPLRRLKNKASKKKKILSSQDLQDFAAATYVQGTYTIIDCEIQPVRFFFFAFAVSLINSTSSARYRKPSPSTRVWRSPEPPSKSTRSASGPTTADFARGLSPSSPVLLVLVGSSDAGSTAARIMRGAGGGQSA